MCCEILVDEFSDDTTLNYSPLFLLRVEKMIGLAEPLQVEELHGLTKPRFNLNEAIMRQLATGADFEIDSESANSLKPNNLKDLDSS